MGAVGIALAAMAARGLEPLDELLGLVLAEVLQSDTTTEEVPKIRRSVQSWPAACWLP